MLQPGILNFFLLTQIFFYLLKYFSPHSNIFLFTYIIFFSLKYFSTHLNIFLLTPERGHVQHEPSGQRRTQPWSDEAPAAANQETVPAERSTNGSAPFFPADNATESQTLTSAARDGGYSRVCVIVILSSLLLS